MAHALLAWLTGRLALRLGGGPFAATLSAFAVATSPILLGLGHLLTMNAFESALLAGVVLVLLGLLEGGEVARGWLLAGALAAAAVLFKYSSAMVLLCLLAGLLATPARSVLASRWALVGAALGVALVLPNFLWQMERGFPFIELVSNGVRFKNAPMTPAALAGALLLEGGALHALLWIPGIAWLLLGEGGRRFRWLGLGLVAYLGILFLTGGKPYYFAVALPVLLAAGAQAIEVRLRRPFARSVLALSVVASGLALLPYAVPILPVEAFVRYQAAIGIKPARTERHATGVLPQTYADMFGWRELADGVAGAVRSLPEADRRRALIFTQNYGEAAALELYGPEVGLETPVVSGHNQYWIWGLPAGRDVSIIVGDEDEDCDRNFEEKVRLGRLPEVPYALPSESGRTLWICRGPKQPLEQLWKLDRHYQ
jgi:hypothetical protein